NPSPDCGFVFKHPGEYEVSAVTSWTVSWSGAGFGGTSKTTRTVVLPDRVSVDELHAVIVANPTDLPEEPA
ncbi:MAG: hypothetical protein FWC46_08345, partial [Actinomycetia bacterium]|nr:hypothetical protein [Actinomycetes bacterium]